MKPTQRTQQLTNRLAAESCKELFGDYGVSIEESEDAKDSSMYLCGVIGFSGEKLRGTCVLTMTEEPLRRSNPVSGSQRDWLCELTNQLAGRLKNKLLARGAEVYITFPVVLSGERIAPLSRQSDVPICFVSGGGVVCLWVEVEATDDEVLSDVPIESQSAMEGDAMMF